MDEKESLNIILEMVNKTKANINENGISAILWGTVIGICGFFTFSQTHFNWGTDSFDIWYLPWLAIIPQIYLNIKNKRNKHVKSHTEDALGAIWIIYFVSIMGLLAYISLAPAQADKALAAQGHKLFLQNSQNQYIAFQYQVPSFSSLMLLIYFIPTVFTGLITKFKPMIFGGIFIFGLFILSIFTSFKIDMFFQGLAGVFGWLIPGIILYRKFKKANV